MKYFSIIFLIVFSAISMSFLGILLASRNQLSALTPIPFEEGDLPMPKKPPGEVQQGAEVYRTMGCASCHTRMVLAQRSANDFQKGWAKALFEGEPIERQSVPRDYLYYSDPLVGTGRRGGDLFNIGSRLSESEIYAILRNDDGIHGVGYEFLFDHYEGKLLPSESARVLVEFLTRSSQNYNLPEAPIMLKDDLDNNE